MMHHQQEHYIQIIELGEAMKMTLGGQGAGVEWVNGSIRQYLATF